MNRPDLARLDLLQMSGGSGLVLLATLALLTVPAVGAYVNTDDPWIEAARLQDDKPETGDEFGSIVALDGDTMVVGHPMEDDEDAELGHNVGAVTVYERNEGTWTQVDQIMGPEPLGRFGSAVALDEGTFVTNAPGQSWYDPDERGSVCGHSTGELYVYERTDDGWTFTQALQPPDTEPHHSCLGGAQTATQALALDGNLLVAGAPQNEGNAYLYVREDEGWELHETWERPGDDSFGRVDVSEQAGRVAIGSLQTSGGLANESAETSEGWVAVRVYDRTATGWNHTATFHDEIRITGYRVELSEDGTTLAATGSPWSGHPASEGYVPVHVWEETSHGWSHATELHPQDERDADPWLSDVELSAGGDTLVVGTWVDDMSTGHSTQRDEVPASGPCVRLGLLPERVASPCGTGATYVFRKNASTDAWEQTAKITQRDDVGMDFFGWDVALDEETLAVGAPGHTLPTANPDAEEMERYVDNPILLLVDRPDPCCHGVAYTYTESDLLGEVLP